MPEHDAARSAHRSEMPTSRRQFIGAGLLLMGQGAIAAEVTAQCHARVSGQSSWFPEPPQQPAREDTVQLPGGANLWYWDTEGSGEAIVLLHPATGSAAIWGYQQPVLAKAGYRVIGYSRRGHYRSGAGNPERPGTGTHDLRELLDHLGIARAHLVGSAAGGFVPPDFALSFPDRVRTMTLACTLAGVQDAEFVRATQRILPPGFYDMPPDFRELSASYRAAYPQGVARWLELERIASSGVRVRQESINSLQWSDFVRIRVPTLLMTGDADLYMPPARMSELARHIRDSEYAVIADAGHSAYWEQPEAFNRTLLAFLAKHVHRQQP
jgi:pimeloyl-ACP methyl ester carboxylesterase